MKPTSSTLLLIYLFLCSYDHSFSFSYTFSKQKLLYEIRDYSRLREVINKRSKEFAAMIKDATISPIVITKKVILPSKRNLLNRFASFDEKYYFSLPCEANEFLEHLLNEDLTCSLISYPDLFTENYWLDELSNQHQELHMSKNTQEVMKDIDVPQIEISDINNNNTDILNMDVDIIPPLIEEEEEEEEEDFLTNNTNNLIPEEKLEENKETEEELKEVENEEEPQNLQPIPEQNYDKIEYQEIINEEINPIEETHQETHLSLEDGVEIEPQETININNNNLNNNLEIKPQEISESEDIEIVEITEKDIDDNNNNNKNNQNQEMIEEPEEIDISEEEQNNHHDDNNETIYDINDNDNKNHIIEPMDITIEPQEIISDVILTEEIPLSTTDNDNNNIYINNSLEEDISTATNINNFNKQEYVSHTFSLSQHLTSEQSLPHIDMIYILTNIANTCITTITTYPLILELTTHITQHSLVYFIVMTIFVSLLSIKIYQYSLEYPNKLSQWLEQQIYECYHNQQYEEMIETIEEYLPILIKYKGSQHVEINGFKHFLARGYKQLQDNHTATQLLQEVLTCYQSYGEDKYYAYVLEDLGMILSQDKTQTPQALHYLLEAMRIIHEDLICQQYSSTSLHNNTNNEIEVISPSEGISTGKSLEQNQPQDQQQPSLLPTHDIDQMLQTFEAKFSSSSSSSYNSNYHNNTLTSVIQPYERIFQTLLQTPSSDLFRICKEIGDIYAIHLQDISNALFFYQQSLVLCQLLPQTEVYVNELIQLIQQLQSIQTNMTSNDHQNNQNKQNNILTPKDMKKNKQESPTTVSNLDMDRYSSHLDFDL